jgi:hypothetical protein
MKRNEQNYLFRFFFHHNKILFIIVIIIAGSFSFIQIEIYFHKIFLFFVG